MVHFGRHVDSFAALMRRGLYVVPYTEVERETCDGLPTPPPPPPSSSPPPPHERDDASGDPGSLDRLLRERQFQFAWRECLGRASEDFDGGMQTFWKEVRPGNV
jgi:hypothetical protein